LFTPLALLLGASPAAAQGTGLGSTSSSTGGLLGGSSSSSTGGLLGGSSSSSTGGLLGGSSSSSAGGLLGGTTGSSSTTGYRPGGTGTGFGSTSGQAQIPATQDPFRSTYYNPLALGQSITTATNLMGTSSTVPAFGQPSFGTTTTTTTVRGGTAPGGTTTTPGFTVSAPRAPVFVTVLGDTVPAPVRTNLLPQLRGVIARSGTLTSRGSIQIAMKDDAVVLTGDVANERERRLAEGLVRLTPGVGDVRNELVVRRPVATARAGP
jgi:hypothetical protein